MSTDHKLSAFSGHLLVSEGLGFSVFETWGIGERLEFGKHFKTDLAYVRFLRNQRKQDTDWAMTDIPILFGSRISVEAARTTIDEVGGSGGSNGNGQKVGYGLLISSSGRLGPLSTYAEYRLQDLEFAPSPMSPAGRGGTRTIRLRAGAPLGKGFTVTGDGIVTADNADGAL